MLQLLDGLLEPALAIGQDMAVLYCNDAFSNMIDVPKRRIREGRQVTDFVSFGEKFWSRVNFNTPEYENSPCVEIEFTTTEGKKLICQFTGQVIPVNGEKVFLVFFRDMSLEISLHEKYKKEFAEKEEYIRHLNRKLFETSFLFEISSLVSVASEDESIIVQALKKSVMTFNLPRACFVTNPDSKFPDQFQIEAMVKNEQAGGSAMNERETLALLTPYIEKNSRNTNPVLVTTDDGRSFILILIKGKNSQLGTIVFERHSDQEVASADLHLMKVMSQQLGMILDNEILYYKSITDEKTKLYNVRYFSMVLRKEIQRSLKSRSLFGLLMLDIDHFKKFNDSYGHQVGDQVLKQVAKTIKAAIRASDVAARFGGEEFSVMLVDTNEEGIAVAAERIRQSIEQTAVETDEFGPLKVTVSVGVVLCPEQGSAEKDLIEFADRALYHAKRAGRNNVQFYDALKMASVS